MRRHLRNRKFPIVVPPVRGNLSLTSSQNTVVDALRARGFSEDAARGVALRSQMTLQKALQKVAVFEKCVLDPHVYGVSRIPTQYYEGAVVQYSLANLVKWVLPSIRNQVRNDHAMRVLDARFSGWREKQSARLFHPSMLLSKYEAVERLGIPRTEENLRRVPVDRKETITKKVISTRDGGEVRQRIAQLKQAGVSLTRLPYKLDLPQDAFERMIKGHTVGRRFTARQEDIYSFLKSKGIREQVALSLAGRKRLTLRDVQKRLSYAQGITLDASVYGVEKIPLQKFETILWKQTREFVMSVREIANDLRREHHAKILEREFPGLKSKPKLRRLSAESVLKKARALRQRGIEPRQYLIRGRTLADLTQQETLLTRKQIRTRGEKKQKRIGGPTLSYQQKISEFSGENRVSPALVERMIVLYNERFGSTKRTPDLDAVAQTILDAINTPRQVVPYGTVFRFASRAIFGHWKK